MDQARLTLAHLVFTLIAVVPLFAHPLFLAIPPAGSLRGALKPVFFVMVVAVVFLAVSTWKRLQAKDGDVVRLGSRLLLVWAVAAALAWVSAVLGGLHGGGPAMGIAGGMVGLFTLAVTKPRRIGV